ncbi:MAG: class I SAM-dependent methyltransferase [Gemmataceae bacterium]|nr:class I SAM-dependent methyltransferase [Gemmataceae bacterium]MDW8264926.1 class I SAM-dependent methyltransferase [Gemmataceae bacterium]
MICRVCDSPRLELALDLGFQPWCNHFLRPEELGREPVYPLRLVHCADCLTAQLDFTVPKEVMFADHTYLSGVTRSLSEHFREVAEEVERRFGTEVSQRSVLDIGSNDGTQLKQFQALGYDVLGVESSATAARMALAAGVPTLRAFFNQETARQIGRQFSIINAAGVFFHLEELHSAAEGIRELLRPDGVFVVQFLYMKRIVENGAFDQIYHEHLLYYNLRTLEVLLQRHGLAMFDARRAPIHGGSVIAFAGHRGRRPPSARLRQLWAAEDAEQANELSTYQAFAERLARHRERDRRFLEETRRQGKVVFGLGAPAKGNTLLNYFGIGPDLVHCLVERNPLRRGLYSPGRHIPIILEEDVRQPPDVYYVLAWNFRREILERYAAQRAAGVEFYFPIQPRDDA